MAERAYYRPDFKGIRKLMTSPEMEALMRERAEAGASFARGVAPRETGAYINGIGVTSKTRGGPRGDRAEAQIVAAAPHSAAVELRDHVLSRAVDVAERGG